MTLLKEPDFGTPAKDGPATVSLEVDGLSVCVPEVTSVMRAAAIAGVDVPKLCATHRLEALSSCRLWLAAIDRPRGGPAPSPAPRASGMGVRALTTNAPKPL